MIQADGLIIAGGRPKIPTPIWFRSDCMGRVCGEGWRVRRDRCACARMTRGRLKPGTPDPEGSPHRRGSGLALRSPPPTLHATNMVVALTGLLAGFTHVLSGPDHLAAVAPLAVRSHQDSWRTGLRWGFGHSAGVGMVGVLAFAFRGALPLERISAWSEGLVGVLLVGIGLWALRKASRIQVHGHWHQHEGETHQHLHFHGPGHSHKAEKVPSHRHTHAAFGIGTLHGLAGSSHLLGVLPALALPTWWQAAAYLLAFGFGTLLAMAGFAAALGRIACWFKISHLVAYRTMMYVSAAAAFGVGTWWLGQMG